MVGPRRPNPDGDPFRPPAIPTEVACLHCGQEYESYLIEWQEEIVDGEVHGFWCCPTPGCDGKGFGFDIFPTDPDYRGEDGEPMWVDDETDDETDEDEPLDELDEFEELGLDELPPINLDEDDYPPTDRGLPW